MEWVKEIVSLISSTTFLNNAILLGFLLIFTVLFAIESHNPKSHVDWLDLILDPVTRKISISRMGQFMGLAVSTWVIVTLSQIKEAYAIFPMIFPMWLAFIGGTWSYDKWLKSKDARSLRQESKEDSADDTPDDPPKQTIQETKVVVTNKTTEQGVGDDNDGYVTK